MSENIPEDDDPEPEPEPAPPEGEPDPAIRRVRTEEIVFGAFSPHGPALLCPRCGEATLEYLGVTTFLRDEHERRTNFIRVQGDITMRHHLPYEGHGPHPHFHGCAIEYGCRRCVSHLEGLKHEGLGHGIFLETTDTQGICTLSWVYDPLPVGYGT